MIECGTHKDCVSQVSPDKHDDQQHEVRVSSQQRHEICVSKLKRKSRVCSTERELHVSEPCTPETCILELRHKVNIHSLTARVRRELKSPRPQGLEAGPFDPPPTNIRDYLTKKRSFIKSLHYAAMNGSS